MRNKVVMITGASGFLGQHLVAMAPTGFEVLQMTHEAVKHNDFHMADYIIHAAGYAAPSLFTKDPIDTVRVNTELTQTLIKCLAPGGSFLFCSSSEIYKGLTHLATENEVGLTTPYHPRACYIEGKRCGETIVYSHRLKGIRAMSARIGLTYGPGTKKQDARVMNQFIEQALNKGRIELIDNGSAIVPCCYAPDMAKMLWTILLRGTQPVYNVGSSHRMPIVEMARRIGKALNVEVLVPNGPDGAPHATMNLSRFREEFGTPEFTSWEDGLAATIAYQRSLYGIV